MDFSLWIEAEHLAEEVDDVCNVRVELGSGEAYGLNVWTHRFLPLARDAEADLARSQVARTYTLPPDLIVDDFGRDTLEAVVADLVDNDLLPAHCLIADDPEPGQFGRIGVTVIDTRNDRVSVRLPNGSKTRVRPTAVDAAGGTVRFVQESSGGGERAYCGECEWETARPTRIAAERDYLEHHATAHHPTGRSGGD